MFLEGLQLVTVYLLHYFYPISNRHAAQHYLGFAYNIDRRIQQQRRGKKGIAANFCHVAKTRKIPFVVAREWKDGDRKLERRLKNRKNHRKLCPICNGSIPPLSLDVNFY